MKAYLEQLTSLQGKGASCFVTEFFSIPGWEETVRSISLLKPVNPRIFECMKQVL